MSISPLMSAFPLKSILKKGNYPIEEVQGSEIKTEVKASSSFQKKLRGSFKRLSFKKPSHRESTSLDLKLSPNIVEKSHKKVTFNLEKLEGDCLHMKPVPPIFTPKTREEIWEERVQQWIQEEKNPNFKKERHFRGNHSYYQDMRSPREKTKIPFRKESYPIREAQASEVKTEARVSSSFQAKLRNSFKRFSLLEF